MPCVFARPRQGIPLKQGNVDARAFIVAWPKAREQHPLRPVSTTLNGRAYAEGYSLRKCAASEPFVLIGCGGASDEKPILSRAPQAGLLLAPDRLDPRL